ncbi:DUF4167 domain-containing protein [Sandaracinobacter neustonicus]|nr:DUF4167 domain-containing protein [Sandaracinobacter neustonicus]
MQNRQNGRRRRGGGGNNGSNPRPMGMASGGQTNNRLEVRVRGNAHQLLEKYKQLARDAHQAGDRVASEYYLQHADHYFRVLNDSRIRQEEMRARRGVFDPFEDDPVGADGDEAEGQNGDEQPEAEQQQRQPREQQPREQRGERRPRYENRDRGDERGDSGGSRNEGRNEARNEPRSEDGGNRQRWQDRRPERVREDRVAPEATEQALSDGEAALVAFGGAPVRETVVEEAAAADEAPKPRRRGRPRKTVEAETVES